MKNLVKELPRFFVETAMFICRAIPKFYLRKISELGCSTKHQRRNYAGRSKQNFESGTDAGGSECVVPLNPLFLI